MCGPHGVTTTHKASDSSKEENITYITHTLYIVMLIKSYFITT